MYIQVGQFTYMLVCVLYPFFADVGQVSGTAAEKPVGPEQTDQETDTNEIRILILLHIFLSFTITSLMYRGELVNLYRFEICTLALT